MIGDRGHIVAALLLSLLAVGCSEFPCVAERSTHRLEPVPVEGDEVRYTYWDEAGLEHTVFDAAEVPALGRHAVLVHISGETTPEMHGPIGWLADLTEPAPKARLQPIAVARARAFAAWSGGWTADWLNVRAEVQAARTDLDEQATAQETESPKEPDNPLAQLESDLADQGIAMDQLTQQRALRSVGSRRPSPSQFGISIDIRPALLFAAEGCEPSQRAVESTDDAHVMMVSDPAVAESLRKLYRLTGAKPAVPTLWRGDTLYRGTQETR